MEITNKLNLPEPLVNAVKNDPYNSGDSDISCTGLIGSAWQRQLSIKHGSKIVEDASQRIYALLGQSVHSILERAKAPHYRVEERLFYTVEVDGKKFTISGQFDYTTRNLTRLQGYFMVRL